EAASPEVVWPSWLDEYASFSTGSDAVAADLLSPLVASGHDAPLSVSQALLALLSEPTPSPRLDELLAMVSPISFERWVIELLELVARDAFPDGLIWVIRTVERVATDVVVMKLGELTLAVPSRDDDALSATIDLLESLATEQALLWLSRLETHLTEQVPREAASSAIRRVAARRGVASDELVERSVPTFGLNERAEMWLDFGPRKFRVRLVDLDLVIEDESNARLDALPKPRKTDDAMLAWHATETYRTLARGIKSLSLELLRRLEGAMVRSTRWTANAWLESFGKHPLLNYFARTMIWAAVPPGEPPPSAVAAHDRRVSWATFRASAGSELCSVGDDTFVLPDDASVQLAHPVLMSEEVRAAWRAQLDDYKLIQPIEQLMRDVHTIGAPVPIRQGLLDADLYTRMGRYGWSYSYSNVRELHTSVGQRACYKIFSLWRCIGFVGHFDDQDSSSLTLKTWVYEPTVSATDLNWFAHSGRAHEKIVRAPLTELPASLLSELYRELQRVFFSGD
ncbi:MAG: DUF4132 domain-containing protein, partial [Polyangiaceae bacterium]